MTNSHNKLFAQFYGGSSYSFPELDDFEVFGSIRETREAFESRVDRGERPKAQVLLPPNFTSR